jgi:hypothetical protein
MSSHKFIAKLTVQQIIVIGLTAMITWLIAVFGWKQALSIINDNSFVSKQIHIPSFFFTLLVLPLPYGANLMFRYLLREYPSARWKRLLNNFIITALLLIIVAQVLVVGIFFYLGLAGGGLDIMLSWQTGILLEAILYALPITILVTLINIMIFLVLEERKFAYWLLLPALVANGMTLFRLGFLFLGIQA